MAQDKNKNSQAPVNPPQPDPAQAALLQTLEQLKQQNEALSQKLAEQDRAANKRKEEEAARQREADLDIEKLIQSVTGDVDEDESPQSKKPSPKKAGLDELSNSELMDVMSSTLERYVSAVIASKDEEAKKTQDGFLTKLANVEKTLGSMIARQTVSDLRSRFPDVDGYREDMLKIMQTSPSLSLEQAYRLAKAERLEKEPPLPALDTERPNYFPHSPVRAEQQTEREPSQRQSNAGLPAFRDMLQKGIANVVANRTRR